MARNGAPASVRQPARVASKATRGLTSKRGRSVRKPSAKPELVAITRLSGSGKASVLKALEDLGFYSVDNLPMELIPKFAERTDLQLIEIASSDAPAPTLSPSADDPVAEELREAGTPSSSELDGKFFSWYWSLMSSA